MAEFELGETLTDTARNHFLWDLLGEEGQRHVDWDEHTARVEITTNTYAAFQQMVRLHLQHHNTTPLQR